MKIKRKVLTSIAFITDKLNQGQERSVKAKKNIAASILIRGLSIAISLIVVPLTINYINPSRYGIWLTLSSIVAWFSFFDIGLSQGLRNKFAEAKATNNTSEAQIYVSTTYALLGIIFFSIWIVFIIVNHYLNWAEILNISETMEREVSILSIIVFTYFCIQFVLNIITTIIIADQKPALASLIGLIGQFLSLAFIFVLVKTTQGSLVKLGIALCLSPLVVLLITNVFLFKGIYKKYKPKISKVKFSYTKDLFNLGLVFFIIQVAGIIQYQTANIIIAQNFNTAEVTSYNIVYKYFGLLDMIFAIFLSPFWSATTEAYLKKDIDWIKNSIKKYNYLNIILIFVGIIMLLLSRQVYTLWLGKGIVNIQFSLSLWGFLFFAVFMFERKYVFFLNGISALRIQFYACLLSPFIYIGVALLCIKHLNMGVYALFIAAIVANFNGIILAPIQYYQIIYKNKKGIWIR